MPVPPKTRMPLRYRAQYSDRVSVYRVNGDMLGFPAAWRVVLPGGKGDLYYFTFDEAVHEAHRLARVRAERDEQPSGECPPVETVRALMQAAWS